MRIPIKIQGVRSIEDPEQDVLAWYWKISKGEE
jgi:hypothetical protein